MKHRHIILIAVYSTAVGVLVGLFSRNVAFGVFSQQVIYWLAIIGESVGNEKKDL